MNPQIIFLSPHNLTNPEKWSGTIHSIYCALKASEAPAEIKIISGGWLTAFGGALNRLLRAVGIGNVDCRFSTAFALAAGVYVNIRLFLLRDGVIVAVAASNFLPYTRTRKS